MAHPRGEMPDLVRQFMARSESGGAGRIFERHHLRLRRLATKSLRSKRIPEQEYDADDLLDHALDILLRLVLQGCVESIRGVDGFWRLYRRILAHKVSAACDRRSALKRGGPGVRKKTRDASSRGQTSFPAEPVRVISLPPDDFDLFESTFPAAELLAMSKEVTLGLLRLLDPEHQKIARMRLDGYTIAWMAEELAVSPCTVHRRLETIRNTWASSGLIDPPVLSEDFRDRKWEISEI